MRKQMKKTLMGLAALAALALGGSAIAGATQGPERTPTGVQPPANEGKQEPESASEQREESQEKGENDSGEMATGSGAERARAAALRSTPGDAVEVERDSENGATWEVEVKKTDGTSADVRLDEAFKVVIVESDTEEEGAGR